MPIFAIIAPGPNVPKLDAAVKSTFPDHFVVAPGQDPVSSDLRPINQIADKLGSRGGALEAS